MTVAELLTILTDVPLEAKVVVYDGVTGRGNPILGEADVLEVTPTQVVIG